MQLIFTFLLGAGIVTVLIMIPVTILVWRNSRPMHLDPSNPTHQAVGALLYAPTNDWGNL